MAPYYALNGLIILSAYVLDRILGDPRWFPHPVRGIGWMIRRIETVLRRFTKTPSAEKIAGVILVILVISLVLITSQFLIASFFRLSVYPGFILSVLLASTTLATRGLGDAAKAVLRQLDAGDLAQARTELSMIVGRDTANLDEKEIARAVIETVAENASDGVIAPLFYLAIGGPALALAYKAVNTLDSMVGYKNERYVNFGWAAARLDDFANYVPARITAVLICFVSNLFSLFNSAPPALAGPLVNAGGRLPIPHFKAPGGSCSVTGKTIQARTAGIPRLPWRARWEYVSVGRAPMRDSRASNPTSVRRGARLTKNILKSQSS